MKKLSVYFTSVLLCSLIFSCKSGYEKQGDKHLKAGKPFNALQRYKYVTKSGSGSKVFPINLTRAYIFAMDEVSKDEMALEKLEMFRGKIAALLETNPNQANSSAYGDIGLSAAEKLSKSDDIFAEDLTFRIIGDVKRLVALSNEQKIHLNDIIHHYVKKNLAEAERNYLNCKEGEDEAGIMADYILSKVKLFIKEEPAEMQALWSKIRDINLSTYLMYDLEGLISMPLPSINRYGVLLAITSLNRTGNSVMAQIKAFNGSTAHFTYSGDGFKLVDKKGVEYLPTQKRGAFGTTLIERSDETGVGGVTFEVPADTELSHIQYTCEAGESIKYLP
jgi:hypothetical protein